MSGDLKRLERFIRQEMDSEDIPGLAACIVKHNRVMWYGNFGYADLRKRTSVTEDTIFLVASVSKAFTGVMAMQLVEQGKLDLDRDINDYLPFKVENPRRPGGVITTRGLLTHTSGIIDNDDLEFYYWEQDPPLSLHDFTHNYFYGEYHAPKVAFTKHPEGKRYIYSNMGYTLLGLVIEEVAEMPFHEFCQIMILDPLGMDSSGWRLQDIDMKRKATPYDEDGDPLRHYTIPDFPNGQLMTTTKDLSKFVMALIQKGTYRGVSILEPSTLEEMMRVQYPKASDESTLGMFFEELHRYDVFGHDGDDLGYTAEMFYHPENEVGVVVLTNGEELDLDSIKERMFAVGDKL